MDLYILIIYLNRFLYFFFLFLGGSFFPLSLSPWHLKHFPPKKDSKMPKSALNSIILVYNLMYSMPDFILFQASGVSVAILLIQIHLLLEFFGCIRRITLNAHFIFDGLCWFSKSNVDANISGASFLVLACGAVLFLLLNVLINMQPDVEESCEPSTSTSIREFSSVAEGDLSTPSSPPGLRRRFL